MKLYRSHGMLRKKYYWHELPGHNFRLSNIQAAMGCAQLEKMNFKIKSYERIQKTYFKILKENPNIILQKFECSVKPVVWMNAIRFAGINSKKRDVIINLLSKNGIETRPGFYTPSQMKHVYKACENINSEKLSKEIIVLPTFSNLKNSEIEYICETLFKILENL